ncbi:MAG: REP element-mobilizing transposase RayT [Pseudohongiellaceae bacterium]
MTQARSQQISLDDTPYYHCISRCVRRAYLCGEDPVTGRNFDHRKKWLVIKIKQLSASFSIDVCAYAIMSNHYHLVLHVDRENARALSDDEVIARWSTLFPRNGVLAQTLVKNQNSRAAQKLLQQKLDLWRERLQDISWFMRCINETVARQANKEDQCSGRFWEGRFKSQALLDEKAVVTCMAYVDLNPIRAGVTDSLDNSDFTSIQERLINHAKKVKNRSYRQHKLLTSDNTKHLVGHQTGGKQASLKPLSEFETKAGSELPISQKSYFALLEVTGQAINLGANELFKAHRLLEKHSDTLAAFNVAPIAWLKTVRNFQKHYGSAAGSQDSLIRFHQSRIEVGADFKHPLKWIRGMGAAKELYGT